MDHLEIAKIAYGMVCSINDHASKVAEEHDSEFAEQVYNSVALTMLTKIAMGIYENCGQEAFEDYWSDVNNKLRDMIKTFACEPTKH